MNRCTAMNNSVVGGNPSSRKGSSGRGYDENRSSGHLLLMRTTF